MTGGSDTRRCRTALAPWRLRRTTSYIEANLSSPLALGDMAQAAGLSRMHFAASFREATGLSPHRFLLWRRIERAKAMLHDDGLDLATIAAAVGFRSQAHFTAVFRGLIGKTPARWRRAAFPAAPRVQIGRAQVAVAL